jgi:hypothetical protein
VPGKSLKQRMAYTEARIRQLEAPIRLLAQRLKVQARKDGTRQLFQIGGIMVRLGVVALQRAGPRSDF